MQLFKSNNHYVSIIITESGEEKKENIPDTMFYGFLYNTSLQRK